MRSREFTSNSPQDAVGARKGLKPTKENNKVGARKGLKAIKGSNEIAVAVKARTLPKEIKEIKEIKEDCPKTKETIETEGTNLRRTTRQVLRNHVSLLSKLLQKHTFSSIWL